MWEYLIRTPKHELLALPLDAKHVDEIPGPQEAKWLFGYWFNVASVEPRNMASGWAISDKGRIRPNGTTRSYAGAHEAIVRCAEQVDSIRHWKVYNKPHTEAPDIVADWFIDPPYNSEAGRLYTFSDIDYPALGEWCKTRRGQVIVCENDGADWLPFASIGEHSNMGKTSKRDEAIWVNDESAMADYRLAAVCNAL